MNSFCLRVDTDHLDVDAFMADVLRGISKWVYGREGGSENPHIHFLIESNIEMSTLRARVKKYVSGNKQYSITKCKDKMASFAYVIKEFCYEYYGYTFEEVSDALCYNEEVKLEMLEKKKVKKEKGGIYKQILASLNAQHPEHSTQWTIKHYIKFVLEWHISNDCMFRQFQAMAYAQTLYLKYNNNGLIDVLDHMMNQLPAGCYGYGLKPKF